MGTTAEKLTYLDGTKQALKESINNLGGNIDNSTTFREYAEELDTIYSNLPKVTGENTEVTLTPTLEGKLGIVEKGNSTQEQQGSPNLFNINDGLTYVGVVSGTLNSDESISYTYDNSSGSTTANLQVYTNNLNIQASTEYSVIAEIMSVSGTGTFYVTNRNSGSNQGQFQSTSYAFSSLHNGDILVNKLTSITSENMATVTRGLRTLVAFSSGQSGSITFRISVLADTTITPQTFHYLPYGNLNPQPYFPIPIKSVTGNNNVVVNNSDNTESQTLPLNLGTIELNKIGTYQDYIYKNNGKWYKKENIGIKILNGTEEWNRITGIVTGTDIYRILFYDYVKNVICYSDYYKGIAGTSGRGNFNIYMLNTTGSNNIDILDNRFTSATAFKTWLSSNNVTLKYVKSTATDTEITDTGLISQLEAIDKMKSYNGTTIITSTYDNSNAQMILSASGLKGE